MNYLKRLLKNKKSLNNAIVILLIGVFMVALSNSFFKENSKDKADIKANGVKENSFSLNTKEENTALTNQAQQGEQSVSLALEYESQLEEKLEKTLASVQGVGNIRVMINTEESYESVIKNDYKNENYSQDGSSKAIKEEITVFNQEGEPIILKEVKPKISGVVIVAEGGDNVLVKNALINAVKALLGIEAHKIEILKMK